MGAGKRNLLHARSSGKTLVTSNWQTVSQGAERNAFSESTEAPDTVMKWPDVSLAQRRLNGGEPTMKRA
jgi:hypothetical protein